MAVIRKRHDKGLNLIPTDISLEPLDKKGDLAYDSSSDKIKYYDGTSEKEVVDSDSAQSLENKTIDATAATGNNALSMDSSDAVYDDTVNAVSSLGTNVQDALDAIKTALDNQNEASELDYDPALNPETAATNIQDALDDTGIASQAAQDAADAAQTSIDDHIADVADAHTASAITNVPSGNLAATNAQEALDELQSDIDTRALATGGTLTNATIITPTQLDVKQDTLSNLETYALTAADGQIVFATDEQKMFQIINNALEPIGGGGSTQFEINQVAHGFSVGDGIYHDGADFVLAQADDADTLAYHVVIAVEDVDNFIAADFGRVEVPSHGFTVGEYYFLSDSVAGEPTVTEPSTFSNPLFYVETADILQLKCLRPEQVGANTNLDDLSDVTASTASEGDVIKYNGSVWQAEKQDEVVISLVAAETIAVRDALYITASGQAGLVDVDDDDKIEFIGFAREAAAVSGSLEIVVAGKLGGFSGLTIGEFVYVDPLNPGKLVQPEPTQSNVYLIKVGKAISATEILVNPDLAASALFNRDVVADTTITNNQIVPQSIAGVIFDGASFRAATMEYSVYRRTDDNEVSEVGQLRIAYKTDAATWSISNDFSGDDAGVDFTIDATGQILYTSSDLAGANYSSDLKIQTKDLFEI